MKILTVVVELVDSAGNESPMEVTFAGTTEEMYEQMLEFLIDAYRTQKLLLKDVTFIGR